MVKKRGPICAKCGNEIPYGQAIIMHVRGALAWVHKDAHACGA